MVNIARDLFVSIFVRNSFRMQRMQEQQKSNFFMTNTVMELRNSSVEVLHSFRYVLRNVFCAKMW